VVRISGLFILALVLGALCSVLPLGFGATSPVTGVLHWPMLLLHNWMIRHDVVMNNDRHILVFFAVNTITWAVIWFAIGAIWFSSVNFYKRQSNGHS